MKASTADLSADAEALLDAILLAFRERLPFGSGFTEADFLKAARTLLDVGAIRIMQNPDESMWIGLKGRDFK